MIISEDTFCPLLACEPNIMKRDALVVHSNGQLFLVDLPLCMQDNDVERETTLNRDHLDYLVEESWRWLLSCKPYHAVRPNV